jgi:CBS domain-containing protein
MTVRDWMTPQVETCSPNEDLACASMIMWRRDCGIVPVIDPETSTLVGVVTDRDICMAVATRHRTPDELTVRDVMTTALYTCKPEDEITTALGVMRRRQVRRLPVVGEDRHLVGVISLADVIRHTAKPGVRNQPAITAQELIDTLREIEKPRAAAKAVEVGPSVMAEAVPS